MDGLRNGVGLNHENMASRVLFSLQQKSFHRFKCKVTFRGRGIPWYPRESIRRWVTTAGPRPATGGRVLDVRSPASD